MSAQGIFVTGTDTEVGKTWATLALLEAWKKLGKRVAGMKPIASGCMEGAEGLRNEDALLIQSQCSERLPYDRINPCAYRPPIAPHIAAGQCGRPVDIDVIMSAYEYLQRRSDVMVVEGIGGWCVPLSENMTLADMVRVLDLPVLLVVGLRLGCINHALLTAESVLASGCRLAGWIASPVDENYATTDETLATLQQRLTPPCLGILPRMREPDVSRLSEGLRVELLGI